jgi:mannose-6-phosphate isomerase-like protein (cupin superfamily)
MINKTNLLENNFQGGNDSDEFSFPIVPENPSVRIDYEYEIELKPKMDFKANPTDADQEILYFLAGTGIIKVDKSEETLMKGDRVIVTPNEKYVVVNTGDSLLHFLLIGISLRDR